VSTLLVAALIDLLGFIGLASAGIIPLRAWRMLRHAHASASSNRSKAGWTAFAIVTAGASATFWGDVSISIRVFRCLSGAYCGPGTASGWGYLALLGALYLVFETGYLLIRIFNQGKQFDNSA
jgi:hypothetical protein